MLDFHLFRAKIHKGNQPSLFEHGMGRAEILQMVIKSRPSSELRKGYVWHVGNVVDIDTGLYFALGRTTKSIVERYDKDNGNFLEEEFETSPYTHALLDLNLQVVAIAKKTKLMPTVKGIANQLGKLLDSATVNWNSSWKFDISPINDPEDFISHIRTAYSVTRFSIEFGLPNPWDIDEDFQQPMEKLLQESEGNKGKTAVSGDDLNRDTLEQLTRSAASSGNDAQAIVKIEEESRGVFKRLKGNPATLYQESMDEHEDKINLLAAIRSLYKQLRYRNGGIVD